MLKRPGVSTCIAGMEPAAATVLEMEPEAANTPISMATVASMAGEVANMTAAVGMETAVANTVVANMAKVTAMAIAAMETTVASTATVTEMGTAPSGLTNPLV